MAKKVRHKLDRKADTNTVIAFNERRRRKLLRIVEESVRQVRDVELLLAESRSIADGSGTFEAPHPSDELLGAIKRGLARPT